MPVVIEFPKDIEESLRRENPNVEHDAAEAYAVELFRKGTLSHFELSRALGIDRFETDAVLQRHKVVEHSYGMEDLEQDMATLDRLFGPPPP
jgi:predicted HTH domain antitoxin